jgi:hypothetical protein
MPVETSPTDEYESTFCFTAVSVCCGVKMTKKLNAQHPIFLAPPNWIQKAPAERALKEERNTHRGIKAF